MSKKKDGKDVKNQNRLITKMQEESIPLSAGIMAVADVFDALVSRRSCKTPFSCDKAIGIIREESGTHFDPVAADAFLKISKELCEEDHGPVEQQESKDQGEEKK